MEIMLSLQPHAPFVHATMIAMERFRLEPCFKNEQEVSDEALAERQRTSAPGPKADYSV